MPPRVMKADKKPVVATRFVFGCVRFKADEAESLDDGELQRLANSSLIPYREVLLQTRPPFSEWAGVEAEPNPGWVPSTQYVWIYCDLTGNGKRWELAIDGEVSLYFPQLGFKDSKEGYEGYHLRPVYQPSEDQSGRNQGEGAKDGPTGEAESNHLLTVNERGIYGFSV